MELKERKTQRGFQIVEFDDYYGQKCSLQESSMVEPAAIWLGVDNTGAQITGPNGECNESVGARMHLSIEQVKQLLVYLNTFVENDALFDTEG
jgi:hypothetical protein